MDEFTQVTGYHRKAVIRLLHRESKPRVTERRGHPRQYGAAMVDTLRMAWEATDYLCSKYLCPFLPKLVEVLRRSGEKTITAEVEAELCRVRAHPQLIDCCVPTGSLGDVTPLLPPSQEVCLKALFPSRPSLDEQDNQPGFLEVDLVAHCGESTEGFYLTTLSTVGVATGCPECVGVWGKGQERVGSAIRRVRQRLPFPFSD